MKTVADDQKVTTNSGPRSTLIEALFDLLCHRVPHGQFFATAACGPYYSDASTFFGRTSPLSLTKHQHTVNRAQIDRH